MKPLAERLRPQNLNEYIGQEHLVGENGVLKRMMDSGRLSSFILWGPPGVGKTTLAWIIAQTMNVPFYNLSAINSGVKDVRDVLERAKKNAFFNQQSPILFIDEIHRFSKSQQDCLLGAVEDGSITLIGATTENPSFEVIKPLLSRCQIYTLNSLTKAELRLLLNRAITEDIYLKKLNIKLESIEALLLYSGGDGRKLLNIFEIAIQENKKETTIYIDNDTIKDCMLQNPLMYDKNGEMHYDIISAFIKSIRGSDPNAAVYWLARLIEGGEQPEYIARRLMISAAEDIGLANPNALLLANTAFDIVHKIGWPEARIVLSEVTIYLANSIKSNSAYNAINSAISLVKKTGNAPVPLHLRNAPTKLMKDLNYGNGYLYPHNYPNHFVRQNYMPEEISDIIFWKAENNPQEIQQNERLNDLWKNDNNIT